MSAKKLEDAEDVIHMLQTWCDAYPLDIFPDITQEDIDYINAVNPHLSGRFFAHAGRHFIKKGFTPAISMLQQQQFEIDALKKFLDDTCQTGKFIMWNAVKDKQQDDDWKQTREYCS